MLSISKLILEVKPGVTRRKGEDGYRTFSVRIREETVERLDAIAKETGRTRNELIGTFLKFAVENCIIKEEGEP